MIKQFLQHWLPSPEQVAKLKIMRIFGTRLVNPKLWYINRRSVTKAVFIGTFFGLLPFPLHSVVIALVILIFEVNLPIGLALSWLINPLTIVPILYFGFWIGSQIYGVHMVDKHMIMGVLHQIEHWFKNFGHGHVDLSLAKILVTGLLIEALCFALIFSVLTHLIWRWSVIRRWRQR